VSQAQRVFEQASQDNKSDAATKLLPDLARWNTAIEPFFWGSPNLSLAITNSLSGALSLITPISSASISQRITTDGDGYSSAFRMFRYTTKLIESTKAFEYITSSHKAVLVKSLALLLQIAGDNLSVPESIPLWKFEDPDQEAEVVDFVAETQALLASWFALEPSPSDFVHVAQIQLLEQANGQSTKSYYSARAYAAITAEKTEIHGHRGGESDADRLKTMRKSTDIFASAAYLASAPGSKELQRLCNELIADLTGLNFQKNMENGMSDSGTNDAQY